MKNRYNNKELLDEMYARDNCVPVLTDEEINDMGWAAVLSESPDKWFKAAAIREQYAMRHGARSQ